MQSLSEMKRLTIEAIHSQLPRSYAIDMMHGLYVENPEMFASALLARLTIQVKVIDEFEELLRSPIIMLSEIASLGYTSGDCDDCAMLSASILCSIGAMARFRAIERAPDGTYGHVFTEYKFPRRADWHQFDITVGDVELPTSEHDLICNIIS